MALNEELKHILHLVKKEGALSQRALAESCGVSIPKAASLISELKGLGYLKDCAGKSSGGRIPKLVKIDESLFCSLSIDIGMEQLRMGLVDSDGRILARYQTLSDIDRSRDVDLESLYREFLKLCDECGLAPADVKAIALGITGIVNESEGICLSLRNTPGWKGLNVRAEVRRIFGVGQVLVMDSVKAMTAAEQIYGKGRAVDDFILINIGIGLGAGIVVHGELLTGDRGTSGEIGHMHIRQSDELCVCGNYGCLEAIASGWALLRRCKNAVREGVETTLADNRDIDSLTIRDIVDAASGGDKIAVMMIEAVAHDVAIGIGSIINILNPEKVFLAGGLIRSAWPVMADPLLRGVKSTVIPWLQKNIDLSLSELGEWDAVLGGAFLAADSVIDAL